MQNSMSPDASPSQALSRAGVRRVNNMPVYIVGGLMAAFLLVMVLVASDRSAMQNRPAEVKEEKTSNTSMFANELAGGRTDGMVQPEASALVVPELPVSDPNIKVGSVTVARPTNLDSPPAPLGAPQGQQLRPPQDQQLERSASDGETDRIRVEKLRQFEEAVKAKTSVQVTQPRMASAAPLSRDEALARIANVRQQIDANTRDDPTAAYKARLQQIQVAGLGSGSSVAGTPRLLQTAAGGNSRNDLGQFSGSGQVDRWKLDSQPEAPRSAYELRAGFVIPAMMVSGINSDLPGQVIAQVSQDVFDTPTGKFRLIPQGSRLVGNYSSDIAFGQARMFVVWQRIIFPDGKAMDIGAMGGSDSAGYSGFSDQVNNHYFRLFGSAFLLSGVTAGVALSQPNTTSNNTTSQTASGAMSEALGQQLGQVTAQLIAKNMTIAPTLQIRPGYRFNVMVTKDMSFSKPYESFDY